MHAGCEVFDRVESLAVERAMRVFGARYANVQPHSTSSANEALIFSLLAPGETLLGMRLDCGGHLSHGAQASVIGRTFKVVSYGVGEDGLIDFDEVRELARRHRPKLIICGASSYPRQIDFTAFRQIADEADAYLLADISHIAGLIVAGEHPSPIDEAHFTTTSTYKQLCGPRGGMILMGKDATAPAPDGKGTLTRLVQRAIFPFFQGTPDPSAIAAKAAALAYVERQEFRVVARRIVDDARALAATLRELGYRLVTDGTDTHMVLVDLSNLGIDGARAEKALEKCNIVVNRNVVPGDRRSPLAPGGMRLGTNTVALRGMEETEMMECARLADRVLREVASGDATVDPGERICHEVRLAVKSLCQHFPIGGNPD
jgi:glycine hydroxymethyltransferase